MYKKPEFLKEIHKIREKMSKDSGYNIHRLIDEVKREIKNYYQKDFYRSVLKSK